jgi:hypothetical protein
MNYEMKDKDNYSTHLKAWPFVIFRTDKSPIVNLSLAWYGVRYCLVMAPNLNCPPFFIT